MQEQKLYDKYLDGRHRERHPTTYAEKFTNFLINNKSEKSIVDIGCGTGRDVVIFSELGFDVLGVDISQEEINKNRIGFFPEGFSPYLESLGIEYLNATWYEDIEKFTGDTIYINGGGNCEFLLKMCQNEKLAAAIAKAKVIIGESCGSIILCEYFRDDLTKSSYIKGLGYIKDTIIEPHYTEKEKEDRLKRGMAINNVAYGLGVDENTFIEYEDGKYGVKIGAGNVVHM